MHLKLDLRVLVVQHLEMLVKLLFAFGRLADCDSWGRLDSNGMIMPNLSLSSKCGRLTVTFQHGEHFEPILFWTPVDVRLTERLMTLSPASDGHEGLLPVLQTCDRVRLPSENDALVATGMSAANYWSLSVSAWLEDSIELDWACRSGSGSPPDRVLHRIAERSLDETEPADDRITPDRPYRLPNTTSVLLDWDDSELSVELDRSSCPPTLHLIQRAPPECATPRWRYRICCRS